MEEKEIMLYSDDWTDYDNSTVEEECPNKTDEEYTDFINFRWDDMNHELNQLNKKYPAFVGSGYFQGWRGNSEGGLVEKDIQTIVRKFSVNGSCSYTSFYQNGTEMVVYNAHHDGRSRMEIRGLTQKGFTWYENHKAWLSRKELIDHLWNTEGLSKQLYKEVSK